MRLVAQEDERKGMFALFWLFATPQIEVHSEFPDSLSRERVWKFRIGVDLGCSEWLKQGEHAHLALLSH